MAARCLRLFVSSMMQETERRKPRKLNPLTHEADDESRQFNCKPLSHSEASMFSKFTLYGLGMVCITILVFTLLVRDSLCEIRVQQGDMTMLATLAYEVRK